MAGARPMTSDANQSASVRRCAEGPLLSRKHLAHCRAYAPPTQAPLATSGAAQGCPACLRAENSEMRNAAILSSSSMTTRAGRGLVVRCPFRASHFPLPPPPPPPATKRPSSPREIHATPVAGRVTRSGRTPRGAQGRNPRPVCRTIVALGPPVASVDWRRSGPEPSGTWCRVPRSYGTTTVG